MVGNAWGELGPFFGSEVAPNDSADSPCRLLGIGVPGNDGVVCAGRYEGVAVGAEDQAAHAVGVPGEGGTTARRSRLATSHKAIVPSLPPEASVRLSGLKANVVTGPMGPCNVAR